MGQLTAFKPDCFHHWFQICSVCCWLGLPESSQPNWGGFLDENSTREKKESVTQSVDIRTQTRHLSSLGHNDTQHTPFLTVRFVSSIHLYFILFFLNLFLLVGGQILYSIVMVFVIHWLELAMDLHVFPIPIPPPTSISTRSLWVFPVHQPWALVSCIQPGLVICFILDSILVSMLFSQNIPPSPSPTESQSLFCASVSLFLFCI